MRHFLLVGKVVDAKLPSVIPDIGQGHFDQFVRAIFTYFHRKYLNGIRFWFVVWKADFYLIRIKNNSKQFANIARCILIEHRRCPIAPMFTLCNTVICLSNWLGSHQSYRLFSSSYMQKILMQLLVPKTICEYCEIFSNLFNTTTLSCLVYAMKFMMCSLKSTAISLSLVFCHFSFEMSVYYITPGMCALTKCNS